MTDEADDVADSGPADAARVEDGAASPAGSATSGPSAKGSSPAFPVRGQARKVPLTKDSADDAESAVPGSDPTLESGVESGDREAAVVGAAAAGSARAAARRSGVRGAAVTPAKGVATRPRDVERDDRVGLFARLGRFFREVVAELRKVIWPARNQMVTYTIVVIVFVVIMVALVAGLDVLFARGVLWIFG